ncbi:hypothetical protein [Myxococcus sp. CA033]|uniref:hypothetical protein n=1 Tax=Myxococcus sp. CA033 TaxID=2741516 RepID=UPI00352C7BAE
MWRRKGQHLLVETASKNKRVAVCGVYRVPDGRILFSHQPSSVNSVLFAAMVRMLKACAQATGKRIVLDNNGAFTSNLSPQALQAEKAWCAPSGYRSTLRRSLNGLRATEATSRRRTLAAC